MGVWGRKKSTTTKPKPTKPSGTPSYDKVSDQGYGISKEFEADNAIRMPSPGDTAMIAAARLRRELRMRSGRDSTRLAGTTPYTNTFLGSP